jgi:hypothetical protein
MKRLALFIVVGCAVVAVQAWAETGTTAVLVTSDPSGAAVYLDGAMERAGETPVTLRLRRGEHRLQLVLAGHVDEEHTIEVGRSRQTLSFRLTQEARLEVLAVNTAARGAQLAVDGRTLGPLPTKQTVAPGRHRVTVEKEGFQSFSRWVELTAGGTSTLSVALQPLESAGGTIFVAGDLAGAAVTIDGEEKGVTPLVVDVAEGRHEVVVQPAGREPHRQTVNVESGGRAVVNPVFGAATTGTASIQVVTQPAGARVVVDGEERGPAPITVSDLAAGTHVIEARADGYQAASQNVALQPGARQTIQLVLREGELTGRLHVTADAPDAWVFLGDRPLGPAPARGERLPVGEHQLVVRAPGHEDWSQQVTIVAGQEQTVAARLTALPSAASGRLTVTSQVEGAEVILDGVTVGPAPVEDRVVPVGPHTVEVHVSGREPYLRTVHVAPGTTRRVEASFGPGAASGGAGATASADDGGAVGQEEAADEGTAEPDDGDEEPADRPAFVYSAIPLAPYKLAIDGSWGWPYLVGTYRLSMGVYRFVDVAVEARSNYHYTELQGIVRAGFRFLRIFGVGAALDIGGGFGRFDHNAFVFGFSLYEGVEVGPVAVALRQRLQIFSDHYFEGLPRDNSARFYLGLSVEWHVTGVLYIFGLLDWAPAQSPRRVLCGDYWENRGGTKQCPSWMPGDTALEGRVGLGVRFF